QVGTAELLLDDSTRLADKAKSVGVDVIIEVWEEMIHVFQAMALWASEGEQAIQKIGEFIQKLMKQQKA
ncbi:MAG: alpha/beta hydrolase, partial [Candidatus Thorarchaeota archaeon]